MKTRVLPAVLLCAALAFGHAVALGGSPAAAEDQLAVPTARIMLTGDSITHGFDGDYTWRYRLYKELKRQQRAFDFVGPEKCPTGRASGASCTYLVSSKYWDTDHAAKGGSRLYNQIAGNDIGTYTGQYLGDTSKNFIPVVIALFGTTDMLDVSKGVKVNGKKVTVEDVIQEWKDLVKQVRDVRSDARIVLGEVSTRRVPKAMRDAYNAKVNQLKSLSTPESPIEVADMDSAGWDPAKYTYDGVHPNPAGEAVIAQKVGIALKKIGVTKVDPKISSAGLKWNPPWAPSVRVSQSRRLVVNWSASYRKYAPKLVRVQLTNVATRKVGVSAWSASQQYLSAPVKKGRYRITIQGRRNSMVSPWGKTYTVVVRR